MSKETFTAGVRTDHAVAAYWNGPITRAEVQKALDDYTRATVRLQEQAMKLDFAVGFLLEKFAVTPEQVKEFMDRKMLEYAEKVKADKAQAEQAANPTPRVS